MPSLLPDALGYLRRGWSVVPVNAVTKEALVPWRDLQRQRPTETQVRRWWTDNPNAGIAVLTGQASGLVVVDIDPQAVDQIAGILEEYPTQLVVHTPRGGAHLYYSVPTDSERIASSVNAAMHIDVRGDGGYVLVPPSVRPDGNAYSWALSGPDEPPDISEALLRRVRPHSDNGTSSKGKEDWLTDVLQGVEHGGRDNAATRLAGYYVGKGMPEDVVIQQLLLWNTQNNPPLPKRDILKVVKSVIQTNSRNSSNRTGPVQPDAEDPFALVGLDEYMVKYGTAEVEWVIPDWLPDKTIAMVVAPPGTFKTWTLLDLAVSVASGKPFLNHFPVERTGPVIVVQQEDHHGQMAERLATVINSRFDIMADESEGDEFSTPRLPKLPIYLHPDRRLRFGDSIVMDALKQKVEQVRPRLVIIDPLYSTGDTDDYMARTVAHMFALKAMRDRYGCSFLLAHHTKKNTTPGVSGREDLWGSQFLNAFLETGWQMRRVDKPMTATIRRHFKVSADIEEETLTFDISTKRPFRYTTLLRRTSAAKAPGKTKADSGPDILALIAEHGAMDLKTLAEVADVHRTTITRRVERLVAAEVLRKLPDGRFALSDNVSSA